MTPALVVALAQADRRANGVEDEKPATELDAEMFAMMRFGVGGD
jgi:hypothetical protein